ncbi:MAG TPA: GNAT family N-acetyltransferase [Candidatus Limnocylindrales bacterium]
MRFEFEPKLTDDLREQIVTLWWEVSNAGGAVGFVPPVTRAEVWSIAGKAFASIDAGIDHLLVGFDGDRPVAMLIFVSRQFHLSEHWRTVARVMVSPDSQGRGFGGELMREGERVARVMGWEGLYLTVRDGHRVERFYGSIGYREVGRLPGTLRLAPGDDRDEILMWLPLKA